MPNTSSAKKAQKQNEKKRLDNKAKLSRIKTERKKFSSYLATNLEDAKKAFITVQSLLAKAAKKGLFHWKKSARLISRMANKLKNKAV